MMDINQYSIYSAVSKNENKNQDDLAKASEITAMLHKFDNAEKAKIFVFSRTLQPIITSEEFPLI